MKRFLMYAILLFTAFCLQYCGCDYDHESVGVFYLKYNDSVKLNQEDTLKQIFIKLKPDNTFEIKTDKRTESGRAFS